MVENPVSYFDYNATTPLCSEAKAAWLAAQDELWLNPSSPYRAAARVQVHLEAARLELAEFFETVPERVVFNSGATEGNNTVFAYWKAVLPGDARIGLSPTEHPSVLEAAKRYFDEPGFPGPHPFKATCKNHGRSTHRSSSRTCRAAV